MTSPLDELKSLAREISLVQSVESLLGWDEQTYMPPAAGEFRAEQMTYLSGLAHQKRTSPRVGELLASLAADAAKEDPHSDFAATIHQMKRDFDKQSKLPQKLVEALTHATVIGQQAWVKARAANDFSQFQPHLEKIFGLKREQAEAVGYVAHPYDALLDDYEPDAKSTEVALVLAELRTELVPLVQAILQSGKKPQVDILAREFPTAAQEAFGRAAAAAIGFDFQRGRLDVTHHPFCSSVGPSDCRITTRYQEKFFNCAFFGILHEAGHGMYDQGLRSDQYGLPPGTYLSLGIHESQSRMWENLVGRSRSFWSHFFPQAKATFPVALSDVSADQFYAAVNHVEPSLIRVEADEATYNLQIIVRFELEQALLSGDLKTADVPGAWREKYKQYLGIEPSTDAEGCLQDIHWSAGLIGYFPTYSLGNLYAAQFFDQARRVLGDLDAQFARGEFRPLLEWLRDNIHTRGRNYTAAQLVQLVTGKPLSHESLVRSLRDKLAPLYGI